MSVARFSCTRHHALFDEGGDTPRDQFGLNPEIVAKAQVIGQRARNCTNTHLQRIAIVDELSSNQGVDYFDARDLFCGWLRGFEISSGSTLGFDEEIDFIDVDDRKITLLPRNTEKTEDENGNPNIRDSGTNYFIYPSQEGEDASWLKGKTFQSIVIVRFTNDGKKSSSEEFVLKPHVH